MTARRNRPQDARVARAAGVTSLECLRQRCRIDDVTGCWVWSMAVANASTTPTPVVHIAPGAKGLVKGGAVVTAPRAAWLLAGNTLEPGQVVYRLVCGNSRCINPEHCRTGTRAQMQAAIAATGRNRGRPERRVINAKSRASQLVPVEKVRQAEALFAAGVMQKDVRERLSLSQKAAAAIRKGVHPNCVNGQRVVRGASVFNLGAR